MPTPVGEQLKLLSTEPLIERLRDQLSAEAQALIGRWPTTSDPTSDQPSGTVLCCAADLGLVVSAKVAHCSSVLHNWRAKDLK